MLEEPQLFWFEDILVCQTIYAIVYGFPFIAEINRSAIFHITLCNPKSSIIVINECCGNK